MLIPSPNVAEDHQTKNAKAVVGVGAAWMIRNSEAREQLIRKSFELLDDETTRRQLSAKIRQLAMPDAAVHIAAEVSKLAGH